MPPLERREGPERHRIELKSALIPGEELPPPTSKAPWRCARSRHFCEPTSNEARANAENAEE